MRLAAAGYRPMAWKNGQGLTREIARVPASGADFLWRLSIAEIAVSGDFSPFAGYDRTITLIAGAGMVLEFAEAPAQRVERCFEPFEFSGDWRCRCHLIGGPVRDFNLIVQRSRARASTEVLLLDGRPLERRVEAASCSSSAPKAGSPPAAFGPTPGIRYGLRPGAIASRGRTPSPLSWRFTCCAASDAPPRPRPASRALRTRRRCGCQKS